MGELCGKEQFSDLGLLEYFSICLSGKKVNIRYPKRSTVGLIAWQW